MNVERTKVYAGDTLWMCGECIELILLNRFTGTAQTTENFYFLFLCLIILVSCVGESRSGEHKIMRMLMPGFAKAAVDRGQWMVHCET